VAGDNSFGGAAGGGIASGTFIDCVGGWDSFVYGGTDSGTFIGCTGIASFDGTASGTFINCVSAGGDSAFGGGDAASGTFINCVSIGDWSFGGAGTARGSSSTAWGTGIRVSAAAMTAEHLLPHPNFNTVRRVPTVLGATTGPVMISITMSAGRTRL